MSDSPHESVSETLASPRLEAMMAHAADHILCVDREGTILFINHLVRPLTRDQVIGSSLFDWVEPADADRQREGLKQVFEEGRTFEFETRSIGHDKAEAWYHSRMCPVMRDGRVVEALLIAHNITDKKKAEQLLQKSEASLAEAQALARLGFWEWNLDTGQIHWSDQMCRLLGFEPGHRPQNVEEVWKQVHPDDLPLIEAHVQTAQTEGKPFEVISRWYRKDGKLRTFKSMGRVDCDAEGRPVRMLGTGQDITEQQEINQQLLESKERLDLAVHATELGLWDWNVATGYAYFNERWAGMLGYRPDEIDFHVDTWSKLLHPEDQPRIYQKLKDHHDNRSPTYEGDVRMRTRDGRWKWIRTCGRVVKRDEEGRPLRMIGTHQDIDRIKRAELALRESEAKWRSITENSPDHIMTLDLEGRILFINHTVEDLTVEQVIGRNIRQFIPDHFHQSVGHCLQRVSQTGQPDGYEVDYHLTDGRVAHFEARVGPILNSEGNVSGFTVSSSNVTSRKRNEARLKLTQFAIDNSGDAAYWIDADGRFVYVNDAACRGLGYRREQLLGMKVSDIDPSSTDASWAEHVRDVEARGPVQLETTHRRRSGQLFPVEITANFLHIDNRSYICAFGRDITERKRAQEQIQEQGEVLRKIIGTVPHSVFWKDRASIYMGCNQRFAQEAGVGSPDRIVGKTDFDLAWKKEEAEFFRQCDKQVMEQNLPMLNIEEPQRQADGTEATLLTSKVPLRDEAGQVIGILGIYTDITERKRFEKVLVDYQQQLRSLAAQVADAEQAERRRIATGLHDQIGQLLAIAKIKIDALRKKAEGTVLRRADEIAELLQQAIGDTRSLTFELCPPALYELGLEAALEALCEQFSQQHDMQVSFRDDQQDKPLPEEVRVLMFQATRELLNNVLRHARTDSAEVAIERRKKELAVTVQDNGIGFSTTDAREPGQHGGGFGLFNIRERLTRFGGFISIESGEGKGCCVHLIAPLALELSSSGLSTQAVPAKEKKP
ncbi:MAG: PAS domain S-box protein [Phycisphaeraceae bacterium]|nr:PAS domain S-box protein [Phycisphaeraceae bacterium]